MEPTLKQFRAFVTIAETGQITRAADRLGLSQSAVSTLIAQLELNLGLRLFDRHTRLLRLTQAGTEALEVARQAVADLDRLVQNAQDLNSFSRGRVGVAAGTVQAALLLPKLIKSFSEKHPNIDVSLHDVAERAMIDMVRSGAADIGIGTIPSRETELVGIDLYTDYYLIVLPPNHPFARYKSLRWRDLIGETLIAPQRGNPIRERLQEELERIGIDLTPGKTFLEVHLPLTILGMVQAGLGIAIMTTAVKPLSDALGLVSLQATEPVVSRKISLIQRSDHSLSPASALFRDFAHRAIAAERRAGN